MTQISKLHHFDAKDGKEAFYLIENEQEMICFISDSKWTQIPDQGLQLEDCLSSETINKIKWKPSKKKTTQSVTTASPGTDGFLIQKTEWDALKGILNGIDTKLQTLIGLLTKKEK